MSLPEINIDEMQRFLLGLLNTPSPTGFSDRAIEFTRKSLEGLPGITMQVNTKGALLISWQGRQNTAPRALSAHVDTLGAMVKEILPSGRLRLTRIGGLFWNSVEGENCTIFTEAGETVRGTILINKASTHVYGVKVGETKREEENMEVRLDAVVKTADDTRALGIRVGDFVAFDPRAEWINGFIRSRHLDDKAGVACLVSAIRSMSAEGLLPEQTTHFLMSNFEEVGHGAASGIPADVVEVISVDMAAVGEGQNSDEFHTTICTLDSTGPYHKGLSSRLRKIAEEESIPCVTDIYPHYGSDGSAFWAAGGEAAVALIGPGVDASHNYERTHLDALLATTRLVMGYLLRA